jgi:hypothetical protein
MVVYRAGYDTPGECVSVFFLYLSARVILLMFSEHDRPPHALFPIDFGFCDSFMADSPSPLSFCPLSRDGDALQARPPSPPSLWPALH